MTRIAYIDGKIQYGRGRAASVLGQPFNVYRLTDNTNTGIVTGSPVIANFPANIGKHSKNLDDQLLESIAVELRCDNRQLQLGDVLVPVKSYGSQPKDIWTIVQKRPLGKTFAIRTNFLATISRPNPSSGAASQQPTGGGVTAPKGWSGVWKENDLILTLVNGDYGFSSDPSAIPAQVYVGLQPNGRIRDGNTLRVPTEQWRDQFAMYVPMLGGEMVNELDRIHLGQSDGYETAKLHIPAGTQFYGQILVVEKLGGS